MMSCREFSEIADSYLSDELLVETNHDLIHHLEQCRDCRGELNIRRQVRTKLRLAIINAEESTINSFFASNLKANLREQAKQKTLFSFRNLIFAPASFATIFLIVFGFFIYQNSSQNLAMWQKLSDEALETHKECAIEHKEEWLKNASVNSADKINFKEQILTPLKVKYNENIDLMDMHECYFHGKKYRHYVLKSGEHVVSYLQNETDNAIPTKLDANNDKILSQPREKFQLASFNGKMNPIFIISDMTEAENLNLARMIQNSPSI